MFDAKIGWATVVSKTDVPADAIFLGTKIVDTHHPTWADVNFDDVPNAERIKKLFASNLLLDRLQEFTYLLVEFDVDLDSCVVQWYFTFPNDEMKVQFVLSETPKEILGGLY